MYIQFGRPNHRISDLHGDENLATLKRSLPIAIIDDNAFPRVDALRRHGYHIDELGGDIRSVSQVANYPVVVCDIRGVGAAFASKFEGAHVISEIRKTYPDKYLIAFTGETYSINFNTLIASADVSLEKDVSTDTWNEVLESALHAIGTPKNRWIRFRTSLSSNGVDAFDIYSMEQAFIKAVKKRDPELMKRDKAVIELPPYLKPLALAFAETAIKIAVKQIGG